MERILAQKRQKLVTGIMGRERFVSCSSICACHFPVCFYWLFNFYNMTLESQVVSLELAKRLAALGVKQESLFWWEEWTTNDQKYFLNFGRKRPEDLAFAAYTVAELGEMLEFNFHSYFDGEKWFIRMSVMDDGFRANTEADARAKMLIYLIENKIITL